MAPPASKRRKRNVVASSSDDEDDDEPVSKPKRRIMDLISSSPNSKPETKPASSVRPPSQIAANFNKPQTRAKTANFPHNAAPIRLPNQVRGKAGSKSVSSSPEKSRLKFKVEDKVKSGDISSLFTKQAQRQAESKSNGALSIPKTPIAQSTADDFDMISDDDEFYTASAQPSSLVGLAAKKRAQGSQTFKNSDSAIPSASQKFMQSAKSSVDERRPEDWRPWAEKFAPTSLEELAVHKRKVTDVQTWLDDVTNGRLRQRVLLLKGAAGTGKTTTLQLLAAAMDCEVLEWRNPIGSVATADGVQSMTAQFEEFMGRGGKFGQLDIFSGNETIPVKPQVRSLDRRQRLILIEEFPNTFTKSSIALQSFRSTILQYLASNTPPLTIMSTSSTKESITPVIMVVSETLLTTTSASADSFTAHRLLGPEILHHPGVRTIEFNAIAPTLLAKALEVIVQKESRKSGRRRTPGPLVLKKLGEIGDIRSAIGSLEFLCLRGDADGDWGSKVAFGKTKRGSKDVALTQMETESLELVTRREASLGIFHAVGKVVYNKRLDPSPFTTGNEDVEKLPGFMSLHSRPKRSEISVDTLIDETGTDTPTFVAALHENYILSCDAPPTSFDVSTLDHVNGCLDALSNSDLLCPSWDGSLNSTGFGGGRGSGGDILRQDEISFQIAVRGLLFSLPNPVTRQVPAAGGLRKGKGGDAYRMFYPTSLKLWRTKEDIESTLDIWVTRLLKGEIERPQPVTSGAKSFLRPVAGSVESWKTPRNTTSSESKKEDEPSPLMAVGGPARKEMLLERLPYMLAIARGRKNSTSALAIRDMEKVTTFHGIGGPLDDDSDQEEDTGAVGENWATDKPVEGKSPRKKGLVMREHGLASRLAQPQEQKLVLSDDDIEDD